MYYTVKNRRFSYFNSRDRKDTTKKHLVLFRGLTFVDYVSLSGIIFIWLGILAILHQQAFIAIICTLLAFCIDMCDGWVSRKRHTTSRFGLQLDTIIDTLNYPIFNALFAYQFIFYQSFAGSCMAIIILIFSSLRLSRMAVDGIKKRKEVNYYEGVVTPHILAANIVLFYISFYIVQIPQMISFIILATLSILMISVIKTIKPKNLYSVITLVILLGSISIYGIIIESYLK